MKVEVSIGELIDKWTILKIKSQKILDQTKLINIKKEIEHLYNEILKIEGLINDDLSENLLDVNKNLWQVEDDLRLFELNNIFDESFISLARSVYKLNDLRASIKMKINLKYKSNFIEEKSHIFC